MKRLIVLTLASFLIECSPKTEEMKNKGNWDSYLAIYEKGPGSTLVNMDLIKTAPIKNLPYVLITGVAFTNCTKDGFPNKDEFNNLYKISDDVKEVITKSEQIELAGTFTYQSERLDYIYIADSIGIRDKLAELYKSKYNNYKYYINIQHDINWDAYLNFLYPSDEIQESMKNQKIISQLQANGDDLSKARQVDYWIYFGNTNDRDGFKKIIENEGFKVESEDKLDDKSNKPFKLHISRIDKVDAASIDRITLELKNKAKQMKGDYDGWETSIVK